MPVPSHCSGEGGRKVLKSTDGLMKQKHTQQKRGAVGAMPSNPLSLKSRGGVAYKDRGRPPPPRVLSTPEWTSASMSPHAITKLGGAT